VVVVLGTAVVVVAAAVVSRAVVPGVVPGSVLVLGVEAAAVVVGTGVGKVKT